MLLDSHAISPSPLDSLSASPPQRATLASPVAHAALVGLVGLAVAASSSNAQTFTAANTADMNAHVSFSTGATWVDVDGDGDLDLYVVTGFGTDRNNVLYRNDAGTFVKVTGVPLVLDNSDTACSTWADVDNDGDIDAFVSNLATGDGRLYRSSAPGVLSADLSAGLPPALKGVGCAWGDYDNDGAVDLVIAELFGQGGITTPNRLFHNDGAGVFTAITTGPVVTTTGTFHHPTWADYDGDGDQDLFFATGSISGGTNPDRMYRNLLKETGTATFEAITTAPIATEARSSQTLQWVDFDNDGDLDLFAVNYNTVPCQLYRNDAGVFVKITSGALVTDLGSAHGATWGDFDNDGDLDVYVATDLGQSNRYYRNEGAGSFTRITTGAFVNEARSNYGVSSGDFDGDGDLDLFVPTARTEGPSVLYRNDTANGNHWLEVRLVGTISNRSGVGAKVRLRATVGGSPRRQLREVQACSGYGGHNALDAHFGLGDATVAESLVVEWPSGIRQVLTPVAADQRLTVVEDVTTAVTLSLVSADARPDRVALEWQVAAPPGTPATIDRRAEGAAWLTLATAHVDARGRVSFVDTDVAPGARLAYALAIEADGGAVRGGETRVEVPFAPRLTLAIRGGVPGAGPLLAVFELPGPAETLLEVLDAQGRRALPAVRRSLPGGRREVALDPGGDLRAGIYWVRLRAGAETRTARAVILD